MSLSLVSIQAVATAAGLGTDAAGVGSVGLLFALSLLMGSGVCAVVAWRWSASGGGTAAAGRRLLGRSAAAPTTGDSSSAATNQAAVESPLPPHWPLPGAQWGPLLQGGPVMFLTFDVALPHRMRDASPALASLTGRNFTGALAGRPLASIVHPGDASRVLHALALDCARPHAAAATSDAPASSVELRLLRLDGATSWWRLHFDPSGAAANGAMQAVLVDISALKLARFRVRKERRQTHQAVERLAWLENLVQETQVLSHRLSYCDDVRTGYRLIGECAERLFPASIGSLVLDNGGGVSWPVSAWPGPLSDGAAATPVARGAPGRGADGGAPVHVVYGRLADLPFGGEGMVEIAFHNGATIEQHETAQHAVDAFADALQLVVANFQSRLALRDQALRDGLTGLYNRRHFDTALTQELNRSARSATGFTLALIDIDHFKSFNDAFGHDAGDAVLKAVAGEVAAFVRSYDVACRVGGEELALLLPDAAVDEACGRLETLRERIAAIELTYDGVLLPPVTVSIGAAESRCLGSASPLRCADAALYAAKRAGRNRLVRWEADWELSSSFGAFDGHAVDPRPVAGGSPDSRRNAQTGT